MVQDNVCVSFVAGREHDNFEVLIHHFKALARKWPDVEPGLQHLAGHRGNVQVHIRLSVGIFNSHAVGEGLVQVKDYCLFNAGFRKG